MVELKNIIDVTDLYHPHQDVGDNVDILAPYAMDEINLLAVILDTTGNFRQPETYDNSGLFLDNMGPREAGIIPMNQLNAIFDKNVPFAPTPYEPMKSPEDKLLSAPRWQQQGIELILKTLREASGKTDILVFSSLRAVAAAYNREPELFLKKAGKIHISAGSASADFIEWNIALDKNAAVRLFTSDLQIYIYPCATESSPFEMCQYNTYWRLDNMEFIRKMEPRLKSYLQYAFTRSSRIDFLRAVEEDADEALMEEIYKREHRIWETALWLEVSGRKLVKHSSGGYSIVRPEEVSAHDVLIKTEMKNCNLSVHETGGFDFELTEKESNFKIFYREDPEEYCKALNEAYGKWYNSFQI